MAVRLPVLAMDWDKQVESYRIVFDACVRQSADCRRAGRLEEALQWCSTAAVSASATGWFGELSSPALEEELRLIAREIPTPPRAANAKPRPQWLHVMSEAYATLGHTNLCRRWIEFDRSVVHDVILISQRGPAPRNLIETVQSGGGKCVVLDCSASFLKRAGELRAYAWQNADVVVLHTHTHEILALAAFGIENGPPVLLLNHADHAFWAGCSIADRVLDIRTSGQQWTRKVRGVDRSVILPIPLLELAAPVGDRNAARRALGLPEDATILLTVGSEFKYRPNAGMDFLAAARQIVNAVPGARLVAVGPYDTDGWLAARKETGGRIVAIGRQPNTDMYCQAADVYLEGFPSGSLTALLEAGLSGLPCVRAPMPSRPPVCSDGEAIDFIPQPADVAAYADRAVALVRDPRRRLEEGRSLQTSIRAMHCGRGWRERLESIKRQIPSSHSLHPAFVPGRLEKDERDWHLAILHSGKTARNAGEIVAPIFIQAWEQTAARPLIDEALWGALQALESGHRQTASNGTGFWPAGGRWRQNLRIKRQGAYARLFSDARNATKAGRRDSARHLIYGCLFAKVTCLGDLDWLKLFFKLHLNEALQGRVRRLLHAFRNI